MIGVGFGGIPYHMTLKMLEPTQLPCCCHCVDAKLANIQLYFSTARWGLVGNGQHIFHINILKDPSISTKVPYQTRKPLDLVKSAMVQMPGNEIKTVLRESGAGSISSSSLRKTDLFCTSQTGSELHWQVVLGSFPPLALRLKCCRRNDSSYKNNRATPPQHDPLRCDQWSCAGDLIE